MISFELDAKGLAEMQKLISRLNKAQLKKATRQALRETLGAVSQAAYKGTSQIYTIKQARVRKSIRLKMQGDSGLFISKSGRVALENYFITPKKRPRKRYNFYSAIRKDSSPELQHKTFLGKNGAVFRRITSKSYPINRASGPAIPELIGEDSAITESMHSAAESTFIKRYTHAAKYILGVKS